MQISSIDTVHSWKHTNMKQYANLDIHGDFKLRKTFINDLSTQGGFYSKFFGEVAYKADITAPVESSGDEGFYGINIKLTNNTQRFKGINVVTFHADNFYLEPTEGDNDEVIVTLAGASQHIERNNSRVTVTNTGPTSSFIDYTIPANRLRPGRMIEMLIAGSHDAGTLAAQGFYLNLLWNGETVWIETDQDPGPGITTEAPLNCYTIITQENATQARIYQEYMFTGGVAATTGIGDLATIADNGAIASILVNSDPTVANNFKVKVRLESNSGTFVRRYMVVRYL